MNTYTITQKDKDFLDAMKVLFTKLVDERHILGSCLQIAVSGNGECFAVYLDDKTLADRIPLFAEEACIVASKTE